MYFIVTNLSYWSAKSAILCCMRKTNNSITIKNNDKQSLSCIVLKVIGSFVTCSNTERSLFVFLPKHNLFIYQCLFGRQKITSLVVSFLYFNCCKHGSPCTVCVSIHAASADTFLYILPTKFSDRTAY